jgi:hypothetical protein
MTGTSADKPAPDGEAMESIGKGGIRGKAVITAASPDRPRSPLQAGGTAVSTVHGRSQNR